MNDFHICVFGGKPSNSGVYCILTAHLNSNAKLSSQILGLGSDLRKFIVEKVDSHIHILPHVLKIFITTEFNKQLFNLNLN